MTVGRIALLVGVAVLVLVVNVAARGRGRRVTSAPPHTAP
jgi:hypothetical protein